MVCHGEKSLSLVSIRLSPAQPYRVLIGRDLFVFTSHRPCQVRIAILKNAADAASAFRKVRSKDGLGQDEEVIAQ
jgi:hypothetical protein